MESPGSLEVGWPSARSALIVSSCMAGVGLDGLCGLSQLYDSMSEFRSTNDKTFFWKEESSSAGGRLSHRWNGFKKHCLEIAIASDCKALQSSLPPPKYKIFHCK
uniref:Uncharacterized protein n=1 Tax=Sphaerodactylus townsendi TaxID=933632 RepID=A0ACB8E8Z8_9SAUR